MRRRHFIHHSGLFFSGMLLSPLAVLALPKTIETNLLIVQDAPAPGVTSIFNALPVPVHQLAGGQISNLTYSKNGFKVTTHDNTSFLAQKVVVFSHYRLQGTTLEITTGTHRFCTDLAAANANSITPECWFLPGRQLQATEVQAFVNRNSPAVLCLCQ